MKLRVIRPFILGGQRQEIGSTFDTEDRAFAGALVYEGKAERVGEGEQKGPMTTETASAAVPGKAPRMGGKPKADHHE